MRVLIVIITLIFFLECDKSLEKYQIYERCEQKSISIRKFFIKTIVVYVVLFCLVTASPPIFYIVFGHPTPKHWIMLYTFSQLNIIVFIKLSHLIAMHSLSNIIFSFLFDPTTFFGFYFAWILGLCIAFVCLYNVILSATVHIGLCSYINAMVNDLKNTIAKIYNDFDLNETENHKHPSLKTESWLTYVEAISFHNDILQ